MPPAKDLAAVMGVNTNTILRALRELRDEGLLTSGPWVAAATPSGLVLSKTRELIRAAGSGRNGCVQRSSVGLIRTLS